MATSMINEDMMTTTMMMTMMTYQRRHWLMRRASWCAHDNAGQLTDG